MQVPHDGFTLESISLIAGLIFSGISLILSAGSSVLSILAYRRDARERKIDSLFTIMAAHREIWRMPYEKPELRRLLQDDLPADTVPTFEEEIFLKHLIQHSAAAFRAKEFGMYFYERGLADDIRQFFSKPIPKVVWDSIKKFQEANFTSYIDSTIADI